MRESATLTTRYLMLAAAALVLSCSNEQNPYLSTSKSDITIVGHKRSNGDLLLNRDTVPIFSTDTFKVELTLQVHIAQFSFHTPNNRLWPSVDTTIQRSAFDHAGQPWSFPFAVSFWDTGWDTIRVTGTLDGGGTAKDSLVLYCKSPLDQANVSADPGVAVNLQTTPVDDNPVLYVWKFGTDSVINDVQQTTKSFAKEQTRYGELYVMLGSYRSPSDSFQVVIADKTPPTITFLHDSLSSDSTRIYTGNVPYYLQVRFDDSYSGVGHNSGDRTVNGANFDTCWDLGSLSCECQQTFFYLPADTHVVVSVKDVAGNRRTDSVQVVFDSVLIKTPTIRIIDPDKDYDTVSQRQIVVRGTIDNFTGYDSLFVIAYVNGNQDSSVYKYKVVKPSTPDWTWPVTLVSKPDTNLLAFALVNVVSAGVHTVVNIGYRAVVVDTTKVDNTPPTILSVSSNGATVVDGFVSSTQVLPLAVSAYDESGIRWVHVDSTATTLQSNGTYAGNATLIHTIYGDTVHITASDVPGNTAGVTRLVYYNHTPVIVHLPSLVYAVAGTPYRDSVTATDSDGDSLAITLLFHAPSGDKIVTADASGHFTWTPTLADTGNTLVMVTVTDGYPGRAQDSFSVVVTPPGNKTHKAHFLITAASFPETLHAMIDTLRIVLSIDQPGSSGNYLFSVQMTTGRDYYLMNSSTDSHFVWTPTLADTGPQPLRVIVSSGPDSADTIRPMPSIRVVPPPVKLLVAFGKTDTTVIQGSFVVDLPVVLSRMCTQVLTVTYGVNAASTADSSDFRLPVPSMLTFSPGDLVRYLPVTILDDTAPEAAEQLVLTLQKVTGDTAAIGNPYSLTCTIVDTHTVVGVDSIFIASNDSSGSDSSYQVPVVVRVAAPAKKDVPITFSHSGAALFGTAYTLSPLTYTIPKGQSGITVYLQILKDTTCVRDARNIWLTLSSNSSGVKIGKATYGFTIARHTQTCPKLVAFVYGGSALDTLETQIVDSIMQMGVEVVRVAAAGVGNVDPHGYDALVLSGTLLDPSAGATLQAVDVPVMCASLMNVVSLGLAAVTDTGHQSGSKLDVTAPDFNLSGRFAITAACVPIPWATPVPTATVLGATVACAGSTIEHPAIFRYKAGDAGANVPPARRCVVPVCVGASGQYSEVWWKLLKGCLSWTVYGLSSIVVGPPVQPLAQ